MVVAVSQFSSVRESDVCLLL